MHSEENEPAHVAPLAQRRAQNGMWRQTRVRRLAGNIEVLHHHVTNVLIVGSTSINIANIHKYHQHPLALAMLLPGIQQQKTELRNRRFGALVKARSRFAALKKLNGLNAKNGFGGKTDAGH